MREDSHKEAHQHYQESLRVVIDLLFLLQCIQLVAVLHCVQVIEFLYGDKPARNVYE